MKVMILAAGEGRRMLPLTEHCPKPLLKVNGVPLLELWLQKLEAASQTLGISEVIINAAYLGEQIKQYIQARSNLLPVRVLLEPHPLETAGALNHAMPHLGEQPFLLINGDVYIEAELATLPRLLQLESSNDELPPCLGCLVLVANPAHNRAGDFCRDSHGVLKPAAEYGGSDPAYTFAGVSLLSPKIIRQYPHVRERFALREVFDWAMASQQLRGEVCEYFWLDVGTPARLRQLEEHL